MIWIADPNPKMNPRFFTAYDVDAASDVSAKMKFAFRCAIDMDGVWKLEGGLFDGENLKGVPECDHASLDDCKAEVERIVNARR